MTPYYEDDLVTIYNADCADVLPSIDPATVDLVLTDPPYGIAIGTNYAARGGGKRADLRKTHQAVAGDDESFDPTPLLAYRRAVLWGANNYASRLPESQSWLVWDRCSHSNATDAELAWTNLGGAVRKFTHAWDGFARASENSFHVHPTQKPVSLMRWVLDRWSKPGDLILDPYMGSGPVAQACHEMGRRYIGVEIVEDYCRIAVDRLRQGAFTFEEGA